MEISSKRYGFWKILVLIILFQESPAYDQTELHKMIHWSSGKKEIGEQFDTPRKLFDDSILKGALTLPNILDSPSEVF